MHELNLWAAWIGILVGMISGAALGLFFHRAEWMGGYDAWRRRLARLGHISFFGLAFVNLAFFLTVDRLGGGDPPALLLSSRLLVAGAVLMPAVCFLSAWRQPWRRLFVLPIGCLVLGVVNLLFWRVSS